ncbi:MAG: hypothetical protein JU82_00355 [Sulfuricurvum sp. MLSB]|uniref:hypothetical protein n=1 Tax=unclassified Sulfuricurvum TaxID=2632390 RepID=UPI0005044F44|nr:MULTISPECIES: hypothetical protein [unclassified Sulfuricurvum]KFN40866.1 MAG: hypothetical protein JU82_00355 [Sulfuricurvum sp. MLSB]
MSTYQHVETAIVPLDAQEDFKLYLISQPNNPKKPTLLGMFLTYKDLYTSPSIQVSNHIRSAFRLFGNEKLRKMESNKYFSIVKRTIENDTFTSLHCTFIQGENVYIDLLRAYEITQAWDHVLSEYYLRHLYSTKDKLLVVAHGDGISKSFSSEWNDSDIQKKSIPKIPDTVNTFLKEIVHTEKI